jgi:beta-xylosidase
LAILAVVALALRPSIAADQPGQSEGPAAGPHFDEPFDGSLIPGWSWHNENSATWSLSERPGWLRIYTEEGTFDNGDANNVLLRDAPAGDYTLEAHFQIQPKAQFHEAGILLFADVNNWVKLSRLYQTSLGGHTYLFTYENEGAKEQGRYTTTTQTDITVRLLVDADRVVGQYRNAAGNWVTLGTIFVGSASFPQVGLLAHSGLHAGPTPAPVPADFDYITTGAVELRYLYLPAVYNTFTP